MPRMSPGYAKNTIRRSLRAVVDPEPSAGQVDRLWEFFNRECAYCGKPLDRSARAGHVDHLVPTTTGGTNHISNLVLSCPSCNGDEKLAADWLDFLRRKVPDSKHFKSRKSRIEEWMKAQAPAQPLSFDLDQLTRETEKAVIAFDNAVEVLRKGRGVR